MKLLKYSLPLLALTLGVPIAQAKKQPKYEQAHQLTADQAALVEKAIAREKVVIKNIQQRTPLVETYIQEMRPDDKLYQVPTSDTYMLNRVDFRKAFTDKPYEARSASKHGFFKGSLSAFTNIGKALHLDKETFNSNGFTQMMFVDPTGFDQQHYVFSYVRREFLGSVRTWEFDVHPRDSVKGYGRFFGRVWIEDQDGNIVRFNGTYTESQSEDNNKEYFHFDSWRMNMQPDLWLPVAIYVEESQRIEGGKMVGLRAQTHFWGYSLTLPTRDSENVSVQVEGAVDQSGQSQDVTPLQATREWVQQAENNVIDRLVQAGLLAPPSDFDKTLEQIVVNLAVPNNLNFPDPIHCRILLTTTVEATTIGNTILISKGLIDTLPNEESIAAVVAMELAHVALGHHIDTRYAFNDRLLFPDEASFQRIKMNHTDEDNFQAAKLATQYMQNSMYKDKIANAGLYFVQLEDRDKALKQLNSPKLGDSMLKADGTPWLADIAKTAPKLDQDNTAQVAALPLGSWLKTDPWDDKEYMLNAKRYAPMNARDKMPFEVTPVYYRLQRYEDAQKNTPAQPGTAPAPGNGQPGANPTGTN
ncbi:M48 family metalloprotease [Acidicapsa dinghuensis]|uniref:M48 family metalloprotease n=1 Tax=Acidicapsa dinghuensis TaxID=2218256 RepID=A0ABW1EL99_9BACT|nr:M48 family metalloprotease [Acidicapsa dinghuensis]